MRFFASQNTLVLGLTGYQVENLNHAVALMPLFFNERQAAAVYSPVSMSKAADYDTRRLELVQYDGFWHRIGLRYWITAIWRSAAKKRRAEIVDTLFMNPLIAPRNPWRERASTAPLHIQWPVYNREDLIPFHEWLREHPDRLKAYLQSTNRSLRQYALLAAAYEWVPEYRLYSEWYAGLASPELDPLFNPQDPQIAALLVEGLCNDGIRGNESVCARILSEHSEVLLPLLRETLRESTDGQQAAILCNMLLDLDDQSACNEAFDYMWRLLAAVETSEVPSDPSRFGERTTWVAIRFIRSGKPGRDYILRHMKNSSDPQQLALSLLILEWMESLRFVRWDDRLVGILARGLENNPVKRDQGLCAAALKLGKPEALDALKRIASTDADVQLRVSAEVLIPYLEGKLPEYLKQKEKHGGIQWWMRPRSYWEYSTDTYWWEPLKQLRMK